MARSRVSRDRIPPKIQNIRWAGAAHQFSAFGAGTSAQVMVTAADTKDTIMRIRGEVLAYVDGASAPGKAAKIAIGAIVMPEGQSTTVVSSPISDDEAPWLFYEQFTLGYEEMVTDVIDVPGITFFRKAVDVKAMRILRPDQELQLVAENVTLLSATSINMTFTFRLLLGQH